MAVKIVVTYVVPYNNIIIATIYAEMYQNRQRPGLRPRPRVRELSESELASFGGN